MDKNEHYVSSAPFDPKSIEQLTPEQEKVYLASQWQLMWWKLKRHRLAVISGLVLLCMYVSILFVEIISPYNLHTGNDDATYAPPQRVRLFHEGDWVGPFVYDRNMQMNMETFLREYTEDTSEPKPIRFFCSGDSYKFWGLIEGNFHLICPPENSDMYLLGTDRLGRDMFSRIMYGARISLTIGLIGILISFTFGVDFIVQRTIEVIRSFPELPLWMALSAVLPVNWSPLLVFFGITVILAMLDWTGLARAVRSKLLALREEDYCTAAELMGAKPKRIITRHLLPGFSSHLIASASLSVPSMILGETALSFLGLGLRPPITSWGVLLNEAQDINVVALYPWLILPVVNVIIVILAFNFFGDGLRDAADPYK